jgi:heptosyltransferase-2/heptosyltransferase-3
MTSEALPGRSRAPKDFLLIQLRQIGDVVLTTPIPHILGEEVPGCRVSFLTERPSDQLLEGNPFIDRILLNDRKGSWVQTLRLGLSLRRQRYDAVIDFMSNPRSAILALLSGAPIRISYPSAVRGLAYTDRVRPADGYAVDFKKGLLSPLGVTSARRLPELFLRPEEKAAGQQLRASLLGDGGRLVTVDPSHRRVTRKWPAAHYGELCRRLRAAWGAVSVVLWGPGEEPVADEVVASSAGAAVKAPPTRLREMAALLAAADLHVGNCSAPRHIAVAVGTPTFVVLGSTSLGWSYPAAEHTQVALGLPCQPCNRNECPRELVCLTDLAPEAVFARLAEWARQALGWA